MKKIKIFMLIVILSLFSGCTINYNLSLDTGKNFTEEIIILNFDDNNKYGMNYGSFLQKLKSEFNKKYSIEPANNSSKDIKVIKKTDSYVSLRNSNILSKYANDVTITSSEIKITPNVENLGYVFFAPGYEDENTYNELKINIYLPYKVIKNNADLVNENTYTWIIDGKNFYNKTIEVTYDKDIVLTKEGEIDNSELSTLGIILLVILVPIIIVGIYVLKKYLKNNAV